MLAYADGGMHSSFRKMLKEMGPERLQSLVAGRVEISRPDAALLDPYGATGSSSEATGSIAVR